MRRSLAERVGGDDTTLSHSDIPSSKGLEPFDPTVWITVCEHPLSTTVWRTLRESNSLNVLPPIIAG